MKRIFYLLLCLFFLVVAPVQAKDKHQGEDRGRGEHRDDYESDKAWHKSKGGKQHKDLPPGWRKKLNKGERVDDTIYVFMTPPTKEVIAVLPPPPPGISFRQIEDKIVKINDVNRQIIEVLELDKLPIPRPPKLPLPPLPKF